MAVNLIESAKSLFNTNFISRAGTTLQEEETSIRKGLDALVPTILAALFSRGQASHGAGLSSLLKEAGSFPARPDVTTLSDNAANLNSRPQQVSALLHHLFDGRAGEAVQLVSDYSGLKTSSVASLLSTGTPGVLNLVAEQAGAEGRNGDHGLWAFLIGLKDQIWNALPAGFSIAGLLGAGSTVAAVGSGRVGNGYAKERKKGGGGWLWVLLLALAGILLWYFLGQKGCNKADNASTTDTANAALERAITTPHAPVATHQQVKVELPGGVLLDAYKGGIEDLLVSFLKSDYKVLGPDSLKKIWFDFDKLNFETGSANITASSQAQINNLVAILKAFPQAKLKIGGYTDKTGNEPLNVKLSGERATAVKNALETAGVGAQIEGAEGYGSEFANFAADAPEEDRVKDRHVSVSVRD